MTRFLMLFLFPAMVYCQTSPIYLDIDDYQAMEKLVLKSDSHPDIYLGLYPISRFQQADILYSSLQMYSDWDDIENLAIKNSEAFSGYVSSLALTETKTENEEIKLNTYTSYLDSDDVFLNKLFKRKGDFISIDRPEFYFRLNPIWTAHLGAFSDKEEVDYYNRRGVEIRMGIDNRIFLYSRIFETQRTLPSHWVSFVDRFETVPGNGFYKTYRGGVLGQTIDRGFDYLNADGGVSFGISKHVNMSLAHGRNKVGSGFRSLLLSDFSDNYFHLKLNVNVWKINYQSIFAELNLGSALLDGNALADKKYMVSHFIGFNVTDKLSLGLFESVVFSRKNQFELQYLNPFILYRTIEQKVGSPDNVILGFDLNYKIGKNMMAYGQFVLDELIVSQAFSGEHWWGNKNGYQVGLKVHDAFDISSLYLQTEYNRVRPFTYSHRDSTSNYTHSNQSLAHPYGAHFDEFLIRANYKPTKKLFVEGLFSTGSKGALDELENFGSDITADNLTRAIGDFGYVFGIGEREQISLVQLFIQYEIRPNLFVNTTFQQRTSDVEGNNQQINLGLRYNLGRNLIIY